MNNPIKTYRLLRKQDVSGVSGTGHIADLALFQDGSCVVRWRTEFRSTCVYASFDAALIIHGHGGATEFVAWEHPYDWGQTVAAQDECENCPFASIGGEKKRHSPEVPLYVDARDKKAWLSGYMDHYQ